LFGIVDFSALIGSALLRGQQSRDAYRLARYATTTDYVFNGDSLVATIDQQTASGLAR
jgi:hypothetical protein